VKNSLNGISVSLDLLASNRAPLAAAREVHAQARNEVARLRGVADDLTLFAAPPRLDLGEADLDEVCHRAAASCADLARDYGVEVVFAIAAEAPLVMRGDAHKLLGALQNVVRNGVEAMGPGAFGEALGAPAPARARRLDATSVSAHIAAAARYGAASPSAPARAPPSEGPTELPTAQPRFINPIATPWATPTRPAASDTSASPGA
jgi:hypothetical protein